MYRAQRLKFPWSLWDVSGLERCLSYDTADWIWISLSLRPLSVSLIRLICLHHLGARHIRYIELLTIYVILINFVCPPEFANFPPQKRIEHDRPGSNKFKTVHCVLECLEASCLRICLCKLHLSLLKNCLRSPQKSEPRASDLYKIFKMPAFL